MNKINHNLNSHKCPDCGSELILIEVTSHTINNNPYPITKSIYRCSNDECQAEADKKTAKRIELKKEQELIRENRRKRSLSLILKPS